MILKWSNSSSQFYPILILHSLTFLFLSLIYLVMVVMNLRHVPFLLLIRQYPGCSTPLCFLLSSSALLLLIHSFPSSVASLPHCLLPSASSPSHLPYRWWWRPPAGWCWSGQTVPGCQPRWERSGAVCQSSRPVTSLWPLAALSYLAASGSHDTPPRSPL